MKHRELLKGTVAGATVTAVAIAVTSYTQDDGEKAALQQQLDDANAKIAELLKGTAGATPPLPSRLPATRSRQQQLDDANAKIPK